CLLREPFRFGLRQRERVKGGSSEHIAQQLPKVPFLESKGGGVEDFSMVMDETIRSLPLSSLHAPALFPLKQC
ncbi:MAG: hypothetical protein WBP72_17870, partial [Rhodocyclaceae bacterium]